jgi:hypothetical protein
VIRAVVLAVTVLAMVMVADVVLSVVVVNLAVGMLLVLPGRIIGTMACLSRACTTQSECAGYAQQSGCS